MTTHGHRLIGDILFGSTIDYVRHRSKAPLLIVSPAAPRHEAAPRVRPQPPAPRSGDGLIEGAGLLTRRSSRSRSSNEPPVRSGRMLALQLS